MYKVYNKFVDLSQSKLQWYILGLIGFFVVLIGLVTRDFLTVISSSIAFGIIYFGAVAKKQRELDLLLTDTGLVFGEEIYDWNKCIGWCVNDLGEALEYVVQTSDLMTGTIYFYVEESESFNHDLVVALGQYIPYSVEITANNGLKTWCKRNGLL
jgi:hypothetical protein